MMKGDEAAVVDLGERRQLAARRPLRRASPAGSILDELEQLPHYFEARDRLLEGEGPAAVGRWLQSDEGVLCDREFDAVAKALGRLKTRLEKDAQRSPLRHVSRHPWPKVSAEHYPELHGMQVAAEQLQQLIDEVMASDMPASEILAKTHGAQLALRRLYESINTWKDELGLHPSAHEIRKKARSRPLTGVTAKIAQNPESRHRVIQYMRALHSDAVSQLREEEGVRRANQTKKRNGNRPKRRNQKAAPKS